jgi:hypothetical protein
LSKKFIKTNSQAIKFFRIPIFNFFISGIESPLFSPFNWQQFTFMAKNAIKGGLAPNNCLRFIKALSPCGVSATGGRGQIYLTGGGLFSTTINQRVTRSKQTPTFHLGLSPLPDNKIS